MIRTPALIRGFHLSAIGAIWHRALLRWRVWGLFIFSQNVGAILLYIFILKITGWSSVTDDVQMNDRLVIILPGLLFFAVINQGFTDMMAGIIYDKMEHVIQDTYIAPMSAHDIIVSFLVNGFTSILIFTLPLWPLLFLFGLPLLPEMPVLMVGLFFMTACFTLLLGILAGMLAMRWDHFSLAFTFVFLPLAALSGSFFPLSNLPADVLYYVRWNPLARVVEGFRSAWLGTDPLFDVGGTFILIPILGVVCYLITYRLIKNRFRLI